MCAYVCVCSVCVCSVYYVCMCVYVCSVCVCVCVCVVCVCVCLCGVCVYVCVCVCVFGVCVYGVCMCVVCMFVWCVCLWCVCVCVCVVCVCVFHIILTTNTSHFPKRTEHLICLVLIGVFCLVGTEYLDILYMCSGLPRFRRISKSRSFDSETNLPVV